MATTRRTSYRRLLTGAMTVAALIVNAPAAIAQPAEAQARVAAAMAEAIKGLDKSPRLKKLSPQKKKQLLEFVVGNTVFVMAHEMGHVLISEMNMPVLGREEDAADSFAVVTALNLHTVFSERVLFEAAKGWVLSSYRDKKQGNKLAFYDEHGLDLQRAYNVVCMMVGSDPAKFKTLAEETKLPEERQTSCVRDYKTTTWSWDQMLKPHVRAADQPKTEIKVEYQDDKKFEIQARVLRQMGLLEALATHAADRYAWPKPFSIVARACGEPNATWNFGARTLTLCYELANEFIELFQGYSRKLPKKLRTKR
jgi:Putative metallopeptidase